MMQNYFLVDNVKYYTGTVFIILDLGKQKEASFICYNTEKHEYVYKIKQCTWFMDESTFWKRFVCVTNKLNKNVHMPIVRQYKDSQIDGLPIGWLWYIFLMAISTIFKGNIILWILISYVFFTWRAEKIKKEGTYIEW